MTCTRDNSSVAAVEIVNAYYGRPDIPVGCVREVGIVGVPNGDPKRPGHQKYVQLAKRHPQSVRHANSSDAPDALEVYRRVLAAAPDGSVTICSVGFLSNLRRLVESKGDAISPLDGVELVRRKVKCWYAMACSYPNGSEYNSKCDWRSSKIALEKWPTPIVFSDFQYGRDVYCGRKVSETEYAYPNPVKEIFRQCLPSREAVRSGKSWDKSELGHTAWDETTVLAAVRGTGKYFKVQPGYYRMVGEKGDNVWTDDPKAKGGRLVGILSNEEVGRTMDDLIAEEPAAAPGETLYNGIVLPREWPPYVDTADRSPMKIPYLQPRNIPKTIPIDVGRQLFVDDFLVASTQGVTRAFFKPVKYHGNPLLWPQTKEELALATALGHKPYPPGSDIRTYWTPNTKTSPCCYTSGGGLWWDPTRQLFRLWYISGWSYRVTYAESKDAIHWTRPPVGADGSNVVVTDPPAADTWVVWPDFSADNPYANWRLYLSYGGNPGQGFQFKSTDGIKWDRLPDRCGFAGDSSTMFYNPFRRKWVWSLRSVWRGRSRNYHEHSDFVEGAKWHFPTDGKRTTTGANPFYMKGTMTNTVDVFNWLACDDADLHRTIDGKTYSASLYNFDATPYESVMIGLCKIMCGRDNEESAHVGMPKTTEIHFAYSRDGFHFDRPDRTPAIGDSGWGSGQWDTGYLAPVSSGFVIKDERLWFFYAGMRGDASEHNPPECTLGNGMHWNGSIGAATLRRDGFAGMVADGLGELTTRPVKFSGSHFFVNADARFGRLAVEVLGADGKVVPGFAAEDCAAMDREDSTRREITWKGGDLKRFAGQPVSFRFKMRVATLFSFWVSPKKTGESGGYLGGGGPDYKGLRDE